MELPDRYEQDAYLHAERLWLFAREVATQAKNAADPVPCRISAVLFAAASVEAFLNELPWIASQVWEDKRALALSEILSDAEDDRTPTRVKLSIAVVALGGRLDKGAQPYQEFALLFRIRDEITHPKVHTVRLINEATVEVQPAKLMSTLRSRGLVSFGPEGPRRAFFSVIATAEMAQWALDTARATISHVVDLLGDTYIAGITKLALAELLGVDADAAYEQLRKHVRTPAPSNDAGDSPPRIARWDMLRELLEEDPAPARGRRPTAEE
jgi:hypothetical protein